MRCRCSLSNFILCVKNKEYYPVEEKDIVDYYTKKSNLVNNSTHIPEDALPYYNNFLKRTNEHIKRVENNSKMIADNFPELDTNEVIQRGKDHDASKFEDPEIIPYIYLTEYYRCKNSGKKFKYPEGMKELVDKACEHHIKNNRHHIDFHSKLSDMTSEDLAEMVADWTAMSQELDNSIEEWKEKFLKDHKGFTEKQIDLINKLVDLFEISNRL
jgi:hypothetical protein